MASYPEQEKGTAPERELPNRRSSLVERKPEGVAAREELERLLTAHDPEVAAENLKRIGPQFRTLLRLMATEVNADAPVVRHHAISALARIGNIEDVNLLHELARDNPDPAVRVSALAAFADSGILLAAPLFRDALKSTDPVERIAAQQCLRKLADRVGADVVLEAARLPRDRTRLMRAVEDLLGAAPPPVPSPTQSQPDKRSPNR